MLSCRAALFFTTWWVATTAQIIYRGKCPNPEIQGNFDTYMFSGRWYEDSRSFALFELTLQCVETHFASDGNGKLGMRISGVDILGESRAYSGLLEAQNSSEPARMKTRIEFLPLAMNYIVLFTDYNRSAVIWSCHDLFGGRFGHLENLWILSRTPKLPAVLKHELYDLLDERGIKRQFLQSTDQSDCHRQGEDTEEKAEVQELPTPVVNIDSSSESLASPQTTTKVEHVSARRPAETELDLTSSPVLVHLQDYDKSDISNTIPL